MPASSASLLNTKSVFTALLAWFDSGKTSIGGSALGMLAIALGAGVLSWPKGFRLSGACLA
ncbi:hypothetical protein [Methylothermus subterraneus]